MTMTAASRRTPSGSATTRLISSHRLGEWVTNAPQLEEDIALGNIGLDLLGQARTLLTYAGEVEGTGRTEDDLAYLRDEREFLNVQLVELPNERLRGDDGAPAAVLDLPARAVRRR